jgi:hypothetical protein
MLLLCTDPLPRFAALSAENAPSEAPLPQGRERARQIRDDVED